MTDEQKQIVVELSLEKQLILDCKQLSKLFSSHHCTQTTNLYQDSSMKRFYILCTAHKNLLRPGFQIIEKFEDIQGRL